MLDLVAQTKISPMTELEVNKVRCMENEILKAPQVKIATQHIIHAGVYARTIVVPAGVILTGSLMKIPTVLIINGDFLLLACGFSLCVKCKVAVVVVRCLLVVVELGLWG